MSGVRFGQWGSLVTGSRSLMEERMAVIVAEEDASPRSCDGPLSTPIR